MLLTLTSIPFLLAHSDPITIDITSCICFQFLCHPSVFDNFVCIVSPLMSDLSQLFVFGRSTYGSPISEGYFRCSGLSYLYLYLHRILSHLLLTFLKSLFFISRFNNFAFSSIGLSDFGAKIYKSVISFSIF